MSTSRRDFLRRTTAAAAALGLARGTSALARAAESTASSLPEALPKLLVLGGTGFLGPALVRDARERGWEITLCNRGKTNPHLFPEIEKIRCDREEGLEALAAEVEKGRLWDVVIDTSAYVPSHVEESANLLAGGARNYVILSTVGCYADHSVPADESSPVAQATEEFVAGVRTIREALANYGAMKALCEQAAEAALPGKVCVVRPGLIVGPGDWSDRFTFWAVRVARGGELLAPGDGSDPVQLVDVRDLAAWILDGIEKGRTGVYNAISPAGRWTMGEVLGALKGAFDGSARFTWVPADFLEEKEVAAWTNLPVWIPAEGEYAAFHLVSTEKAVAEGLGFRPLADTARDTVAWCREEKGEDYDFGKRAGISREREAELLAEWHAREAAAAEKPAAINPPPG